MTPYRKAELFKRQRIEKLKSHAIFGVAITQRSCGDQFATVAPDLDAAMRTVRRAGLDADPDGAQDVVLLRPQDFEALLRLAGLEPA